MPSKLKSRIPFSFILWHRLLYSYNHPIYYRTLKHPSLIGMPWRFLVAASLVIVAGLFCGWQSQLSSSDEFLVVMVLTAIICCSSLYAGIWTIEISMIIGNEHRSNRYELIGVMPSGSLAAEWSIACACIHRNDRFGWIDSLRKAGTGILTVVLAMLLVFSTLNAQFITLAQFLALCLDMSALVIVSYTEHVQSIIFGCLVGIVSSSLDNLGNRPMLALFGFLIFQVASLILALIVFHWVDAMAVPISAIAVSLFAFAIWREVNIVVLWIYLHRRSNT